MTPHDIDHLMRARFSGMEPSEEKWRGSSGTFQVYVLADVDTDRVRVMVPVAAVDRPDGQTFQRLLEANFAASLDVRYAIFESILWAVFAAQLSSLSEYQLDGAISQTLELARTTGTSYSAKPPVLGLARAVLH